MGVSACRCRGQPVVSGADPDGESSQGPLPDPSVWPQDTGLTTCPVHCVGVCGFDNPYSQAESTYAVQPPGQTPPPGKCGARLSAMLVTLRVPLSDARRFSADPAVADSVVLPAWAEGAFLRGVGRISQRPGGIVEPWPFEASFADGVRMLTVPPDEVLRFSHNQGMRVEAVRKRAWQALNGSTALLDLDLAFQIRPAPIEDAPTSYWAYACAGRALADGVGALASTCVRIRGENVTRRLITSGPKLADRYAAMTSSAAGGSRSLVGAGRIAAVVEAAGVTVDGDLTQVHQTLKLGRITLTSLDVSVPGGGDVRCHLLHTASRSTADRKRIRELRIHILRLHSIFELMRFLTGPTISAAAIADTPGSPAFDRLQKTILECVRIVRTDKKPGGADAGDLLDTSLFARRLVDVNLQTMLSRMLAAARPRVRREVEAVLAAERAQEGAESKYKIEVYGGVVGTIGDQGTAHVAPQPDANGSKTG